jgi:hypothetical protein
MRSQSIPVLDLSVADAAYFAGLIDGEGSIPLVRSLARGSMRYVYPVVRLANTDMLMIQWVLDRVPFGSHHYVSLLHAGCKDVVHLVWASGHAAVILRAVLPYMVVKRERALLALRVVEAGQEAMRDAGGHLNRGRPVPPWLVQVREDAFLQMKEWNRRGRTNAPQSKGQEGARGHDENIR